MASNILKHCIICEIRVLKCMEVAQEGRNTFYSVHIIGNPISITHKEMYF